MPAITRAPAPRLIVPALLVAGWLAGLLGQRQIALDTGYLDVSPPLLLLGCLLFVLAGMSARMLLPSRRRRTGALAGVGLLATILAGYAALIALYIERPALEEGGETWFSLLLESWFWLGVPVLVSAGLGAMGWWLADAAGRRSGGRTT